MCIKYSISEKKHQTTHPLLPSDLQVSMAAASDPHWIPGVKEALSSADDDGDGCSSRGLSGLGFCSPSFPAGLSRRKRPLGKAERQRYWLEMF